MKNVLISAFYLYATIMYSNCSTFFYLIFLLLYKHHCQKRCTCFIISQMEWLTLHPSLSLLVGNCILMQRPDFNNDALYNNLLCSNDLHTSHILATNYDTPCSEASAANATANNEAGPRYELYPVTRKMGLVYRRIVRS